MVKRMLSPALLRIAHIFLTLSLACVVLPIHADEPSQTTAPKTKIDWIDGPVIAELGEIAQVKIPAGYRFTGREGTRFHANAGTAAIRRGTRLDGRGRIY